RCLRRRRVRALSPEGRSRRAGGGARPQLSAERHMTLETVSMKKPRGHAPRLSVPYDPNKPRDRRYWTDAELAIVRENYGKRGGIDICRRKLPHRSKSTIYQVGRKLNVSAHKQPAERRYIEYTPALEKKIRERWPSLTKKGATTAFAEELGVPKHWL